MTQHLYSFSFHDGDCQLVDRYVVTRQTPREIHVCHHSRGYLTNPQDYGFRSPRSFNAIVWQPWQHYDDGRRIYHHELPHGRPDREHQEPAHALPSSC